MQYWNGHGDEAINILALSYNVCEGTKVMAVILCVSKLKGASGLSATIIVTILVMLYECTQTSLYVWWCIIFQDYIIGEYTATESHIQNLVVLYTSGLCYSQHCKLLIIIGYAVVATTQSHDRLFVLQIYSCGLCYSQHCTLLSTST